MKVSNYEPVIESVLKDGCLYLFLGRLNVLILPKCITFPYTFYLTDVVDMSKSLIVL